MYEHVGGYAMENSDVWRKLGSFSNAEILQEELSCLAFCASSFSVRLLV